MPKTTNKITKANNKNKKKILIEEKEEKENKKLRGYWTTLAKKT